MKLPSAYAEGYEKARLYDQEEADNYARHISIGDPELDPVMEELSSLPRDDLHRFIGAGIEQRDEVLRQAPQALRDFFKNLAEPPWLDKDELRVWKVEYYDRKDAHLKTLTLGNYQQYLERYWRAGEMTMVNHLTGKSTVLTWTDFQFQTDLDDRDFTQTG